MGGILNGHSQVRLSCLGVDLSPFQDELNSLKSLPPSPSHQAESTASNPSPLAAASPVHSSHIFELITEGFGKTSHSPKNVAARILQAVVSGGLTQEQPRSSRVTGGWPKTRRDKDFQHQRLRALKQKRENSSPALKAKYSQARGQPGSIYPEGCRHQRLEHKQDVTLREGGTRGCSAGVKNEFVPEEMFSSAGDIVGASP